MWALCLGLRILILVPSGASSSSMHSSNAGEERIIPLRDGGIDSISGDQSAFQVNSMVISS